MCWGDAQKVKCNTTLEMHIGEKSNKCNQCDYASSQAGNFRKRLKKARWRKVGCILTLPFGHLPNTFCFISPSICFIFPSNLLHFPKKMLHFPNSLLHFPNKMLHFPNSCLHFPMQCCVTLPKNILPNILGLFSFLRLNSF